MNYPYNKKFTPQFPMLSVVLHRLDDAALSPALNALLDTGADSSFVPIRLLEQGGAEFLRSTRIRSHWGECWTAAVYLVDVRIGNDLLPAVEVIADEQGNDVILGRNVLNKLVLLLDGIHHQTDILTRRPLRL